MTEDEALAQAIETLVPMGERWGADIDKIRSGEDYRVKLVKQALLDWSAKNKRVEAGW